MTSKVSLANFAHPVIGPLLADMVYSATSLKNIIYIHKIQQNNNNFQVYKNIYDTLTVNVSITCIQRQTGLPTNIHKVSNVLVKPQSKILNIQNVYFLRTLYMLISRQHHKLNCFVHSISLDTVYMIFFFICSSCNIFDFFLHLNLAFTNTICLFSVMIVFVNKVTLMTPKLYHKVWSIIQYKHIVCLVNNVYYFIVYMLIRYVYFIIIICVKKVKLIIYYKVKMLTKNALNNCSVHLSFLSKLLANDYTLSINYFSSCHIDNTNSVANIYMHISCITVIISMMLNGWLKTKFHAVSLVYSKMIIQFIVYKVATSTQIMTSIKIVIESTINNEPLTYLTFIQQTVDKRCHFDNFIKICTSSLFKFMTEGTFLVSKRFIAFKTKPHKIYIEGKNISIYLMFVTKRFIDYVSKSQQTTCTGKGQVFKGISINKHRISPMTFWKSNYK